MKLGQFEQMFVTDYKNEVINQLSKTKEEFLKNIVETNSSVQIMKAQMAEFAPMVQEVRDLSTSIQ